MKKTGGHLHAVQRSAVVTETKRHYTLLIALLVTVATIVGMTFISTSAFAAPEALKVSQSNPDIVAGTSGDDSDTLTVDFQASVGDVLSITLPNNWIGSTGFNGISVPGTTKKISGDGKTATLTFSSAFNGDFSFTMTPNVSFSSTNTPRPNSSSMPLGPASVKIANAKTSGESTNASADFTISLPSIDTGISWTPDVAASYVAGRKYTFSTITGYGYIPGVTYGTNTSKQQSWRTSGAGSVWVALNLPGGFELDEASSSGWSQPDGVGGTVFYDPTAAKASSKFSGSFTAAVGEYTADKGSSISTYFGYDSEKTTLESKPLKISVTEEKDDGMLITIVQNEVVISNASNLLRPKSRVSYSQNNEFRNPDSGVATDAQQTIIPADGSVQTGLSIANTKPLAGETITVNAITEDGSTKKFPYTITADDEANGTTNFKIPSVVWNGGATYTKFVIDYSKVAPAASVTAVVTAHSLAKYSNGTDIKEGDVKKSTQQLSTGRGAWGGIGENSVTYKNDLKNADLDLETMQWRSNYKTALDYVYGETSNNYFNELSTGGNVPDTDTTRDVYEPIVYILLPKVAVYSGYAFPSSKAANPTIPPSSVTTSKSSSGQTVVKFDWTGTGYYMPTDGGELVRATWTIPSFGVPVTSTAAVWVSTVNDPDLVLSKYAVAGSDATSAALDSDVAKSVVGNDSKAVLVGTQYVNFTGANVLGATSTITNNAGVTGTSALNVVGNGLNHSMTVSIISNKAGYEGQRLASLTNLPVDCMNLQLTGPGTVVDQEGKKVDASVADLRYSTQTQKVPTSSDDLDTSSFVTAEEVSDWSSIKSFILEVSSLDSGMAYYASVPLTNPDAENEVGTQCTITSTAVSGKIAPMTSSVTDEYGELKGAKHWDDAADQDGKRPSSVTVDLLDPTGVAVDKQTTDASKKWKYVFSPDVPIVDTSNGKLIKYTVREEQSDEEKSLYTATYDGLDVTNTHTPATIDVSGTGTWDDQNNVDGLRTDTITVELLANGVPTGKTATVGVDEDFTWTFSGVDEYSKGKKIVYTVTEPKVPTGYTVSYDGMNLTNVHVPVPAPVTPKHVDVVPPSPSPKTENPPSPTPTPTPTPEPSAKPAPKLTPTKNVAAKVKQTLAATGSDVGSVVMLVLATFVLSGGLLLSTRRRDGKSTGTHLPQHSSK
ncbi:MAG: Cna B-type domain-containing protein [Bifidobacteriaceae bacterium]|jgi:hypothetical protein|nr:Cna B-type domain-containing protein [Bifidobacteriaceae bacterium]MCI1978602.1 Cna B-type domain-containing protein [Bifidobacteriaceae bacterium]